VAGLLYPAVYGCRYNANTFILGQNQCHNAESSSVIEDDVECLLWEPLDGKTSALIALCNNAIQAGCKECLWICYSSNGGYRIKDIQLVPEGPSLEISSLKSRYGWWKRFSFRSAVGVEEVLVRLPFFVH
jgi:hypothetical protein